MQMPARRGPDAALTHPPADDDRLQLAREPRKHRAKFADDAEGAVIDVVLALQRAFRRRRIERLQDGVVVIGKDPELDVTIGGDKLAPARLHVRELVRLDALFEIHKEEELDRSLKHGAKIIGVNNRDLAIFKTDIGLSERLIPKFPKDVIAVSESGFSTGADAARARACGAHALLVGESLMRTPDPAALIREFQAS